jgi:hypothetical protein
MRTDGNVRLVSIHNRHTLAHDSRRQGGIPYLCAASPATPLPRPPSQNTSYSPYASQRAPSHPRPPSARPRAPSSRPRHSPSLARGAPCERVPCGVDHDLRIAASLSRLGPARAYTLCILPPHRPRMRSILGRDAKGDVRLYAGREAINLWRRPTSGVDMRTESTVRLISIRDRHTLASPSSLSFLHHPPSSSSSISSASPSIRLLRCPSTFPYPFRFPSSRRRHTCIALPSTHPPLHLLFPSALLPSPLRSLFTALTTSLQTPTRHGPLLWRTGPPTPPLPLSPPPPISAALQHEDRDAAHEGVPEAQAQHHDD